MIEQETDRMRFADAFSALQRQLNEMDEMSAASERLSIYDAPTGEVRSTCGGASHRTRKHTHWGRVRAGLACVLPSMRLGCT